MSADNTIKHHPTPQDTNNSVSGMYKNWFLDYASYVILDRAVPNGEDGLKPVQRRILHALKEMDDGRYHKVANAIGQTMQFHPHGDASIYEALVNLGQKNLLIDTQGNWGDFRTGDKAAAPRYIEARLSKFALEVAFNKENTEWQLSYDGRKKEPIHLPLKFPLLLAQGVEGIAVGLSTKIMPHNFIELIKASIAILRGKSFELMPDFPTGGYADCSNYNEGKKGSKIKVRCKIEVEDKKTLIIRELPYGVTVNNLIDSIIKANDKGKLKVKRVTDNTAKDVVIIVDLPPNVSPDLMVDALYAFTNCEVSISPNCCVIIDNKPCFLSVNELLKICTERTRTLLQQELQIKLNVLKEKLHFASLEQIFIDNRIYRAIEDCKTFEAVIDTIDKGLKPFTKQFVRAVTREDILRLTEIRIKRISKYDSFKAKDAIRQLEEAIAALQNHLENLTAYTIDYYKNLLKKYGKGRERKTILRSFDTITVQQVAVANQKLYVNRKDGFIGYGLKKDEYICDCSDLDNIIVFLKDGKYAVHKISDKLFVGKDIIHVAVWKKGDERTVYHSICVDGKNKASYVKRFNVKATTRSRVYDITTGEKGSKILYFQVHPNSESEIVEVQLHPRAKAKKRVFEYDFSELTVKGRTARGNLLTKYPVRQIKQKSLGNSTLGGMKIWLDETVGRLNTANRGRLLGTFDTGDTILVVFKDGTYEVTDFEQTNRYEMNQIEAISKCHKDLVVSAVHYRADKKVYYIKRFHIETKTLNEKFSYIGDTSNCKLLFVSIDPTPVITYTYRKPIPGSRRGERLTDTVELAKFIDVKGWRAMGNKLTEYKILKLSGVEPNPKPESSKPIVSKRKSNVGTKTKDSTIILGQKMELEIKKQKDQTNNKQEKLF
ncbi:MAG: DNA gyrase/topoisomerase IV subunit A [Chitinophagales bacterium]